MKMEKPTVEAVRFQSSDVIATSGGGNPYANLGNGRYSVLRSEADQAGMTYYGRTDTSNWGVYFTIEDGALDGDALTQKGFRTDDMYAWFNAGQWQTEGKKVGDYGYSIISSDNWRKE